MFEPLLRFQTHSPRIQSILELSFVLLDYYLMYIINTKLRLPKYNSFTLHLNRSQTETSYRLRTSHQFKYQHRLALRYFNLYNPVFYSPPHVPMDSSWTPHGLCITCSKVMIIPSKSCGVPMESPWSPCGVPVEFSWSPRGVPVESSSYVIVDYIHISNSGLGNQIW